MPLPTENRNDWLTVAAIGILAMCVVTFDHEALGHGGACLLINGHIQLLTSSLFRCDVRSEWIDPAGPAGNLLMGTLALVLVRFVPERLMHLRMFLVFTTAFSYFWEAGYLVRAMIRQEGDLYYFAAFLLGHVFLWQRWTAAGLGIGLYIFTARLTSRATARLGRGVTRTVWISATLGAALAALAYSGPGWGDLRDAVLEIGAGSLPLLLIPGTSRESSFVGRSTVAIVVSTCAYALFIVSLGRGLRN